MRKNIFSVAVLGLAFMATASLAFCPEHEKKGKDGATLVKSDAKETVSVKKSGCCGKKKATTVSADAIKDGRSETGIVKGGCIHGAKVSAKKGGCAKGCKKGASLVKDGSGGCPIGRKVDAILASLPHMTYRVGDTKTDCSDHAGNLAKKSGSAIEYVVGDQVFAKEGEAIVSLTSALEAQMATLSSMQYSVDGECGRCPVTAKSKAKKSGSKVVYRVGGFDFDDKEKAAGAVKLVSAAVADVKMGYKVDGDVIQCAHTAGAHAKKSGDKMTYVVGDSETSCQTSATLSLAKAKIRKIVETAAAAYGS